MGDGVDAAAGEAAPGLEALRAAGVTSDSLPDMNAQNDGDGSYKKQSGSDAQPGN